MTFIKIPVKVEINGKGFRATKVIHIEEEVIGKIELKEHDK